MILTEEIDQLFDNFKGLLKYKNELYGNSALEPLNIFSKATGNSQICNRIDDKISRIKHSNELRKNDVADLFGYLALLMIYKNWLDFEEMKD